MASKDSHTSLNDEIDNVVLFKCACNKFLSV